MTEIVDWLMTPHGQNAIDVAVKARKNNADPLVLAAQLAAVPGLVEHGIFPGSMVERVVVAGAGGVRELVNDRR